jgi:hypothetical protein
MLRIANRIFVILLQLLLEAGKLSVHVNAINDIAALALFIKEIFGHVQC